MSPTYLSNEQQHAEQDGKHLLDALKSHSWAFGLISVLCVRLHN